MNKNNIGGHWDPFLGVKIKLTVVDMDINGDGAYNVSWGKYPDLMHVTWGDFDQSYARMSRWSITIYCTVCYTACVQQLFSVIVKLSYKDRILNFIDLCSTANISVFLLATQRYGFYIHGQCVHGASDVNQAMWYENFRAEEARSAHNTVCIYTLSQKNCANLFFVRTLSNFDRL